MLRPSYSDLLEKLNEDADPENTVGSRYTIVIAAAKRARQLVDHAEPLISKIEVDRPVSIAVHELNAQKIKIIQHAATEEQEEMAEELIPETEQ